MKSHYTDVVLYKMYLRDKLGLAENTIFTYKQAVYKFLTSNPDILKQESYINFLIKKSIKKQNYHNICALVSYIKWKFKTNAQIEN